jgi:hypothetical protein
MANGFKTDMDVYLPPSAVKDSGPSAAIVPAHITVHVTWPDLAPGDNARRVTVDGIQNGVIGMLPTVYEQIEMRITDA